MSYENKLRFYIDQAIMERDYEALATFDEPLDVLHEQRREGAVEHSEEDRPTEAPVWEPPEFTSR